MPTVKEIFEAMPASFQKDAVQGMNVVIQFDITGEGGGKWCAAINNSELSIVETAHDKPDLTITASAQDYIDISSGKLNPQLAFMTGRIRARGDMILAMMMPKIFKE